MRRDLRDRLRAIGDALIPAAHGMPSAGEVGVADGQLDRVLAARPDLEAPLVRALETVTASEKDALVEELAALQAGDAAAAEALLQAVVGGYYTQREVRARLRYDGQVPVEVRPEIIPNYVEEGLLDPVLERGPIYRT
jgi:hypothetical protein